jgi:hypothetical protein
MSLSPLATALIACVLTLAGSLGGAALRRALPEDHLNADARDVIRLGAGLVATIAALVLGLLISSAKSSYDTKHSELRQMTASIIFLDRTLQQYGPETAAIRGLLRRAIDPWADLIWREQAAKAPPAQSERTTEAGELAYEKIMELSPQNDKQRVLKSQAIESITSMAQTRFLLFAQSDGAIQLPFLAVLVFWLVIIFASFSLFSPINPTTFVALCVFALSASGALFLILEMDQPFTGLMQISSGPLRTALGPLAS